MLEAHESKPRRTQTCPCGSFCTHNLHANPLRPSSISVYVHAFDYRLSAFIFPNVGCAICSTTGSISRPTIVFKEIDKVEYCSLILSLALQVRRLFIKSHFEANPGCCYDPKHNIRRWGSNGLRHPNNNDALLLFVWGSWSYQKTVSSWLSCPTEFPQKWFCDLKPILHHPHLLWTLKHTNRMSHAAFAKRV